MSRLLCWIFRKPSIRDNDPGRAPVQVPVIRAEAQTPIPPMPTLPKKRLRRLTIPSGSASLSEISGLRHQNQQTISQMNSNFFATLPLELRQKVYGHIFGNRTIHIEFNYDHPDKRGDRHAYQDSWNKDLEQPKGWRWWNSVCHRDPREQWWYDGCRGATGTVCQFFVQDLRECKVNVAWLSTCRQAYSESIDVLYATNRFYLTGLSMMLNIQDFLLPQRISAIRALDVNLDLLSVPSYLWKIFARFPNLRSLRVAIQTRPHPQLTHAEDWLRSSDRLVIERGKQLEEFIFVVPHTYYIYFHGFRGEEELRVRKTWNYRFWREVNDDGLGYWITERPDPINIVCSLGTIGIGD